DSTANSREPFCTEARHRLRTTVPTSGCPSSVAVSGKTLVSRQSRRELSSGCVGRCRRSPCRSQTTFRACGLSWGGRRTRNANIPGGSAETPLGPRRRAGLGASHTARSTARLPPQAEVRAPVVGHEHRSRGGDALEQIPGQPLFVGPGVGKDDVEVVRGQAQLFVRTAHVRGEPSKPVAGVNARPAAPGNEAAADKLHG